jgi:hypothetical protein
MLGGGVFQQEAAGPCPQGGVDVLVEVEGREDASTRNPEAVGSASSPPP